MEENIESAKVDYQSGASRENCGMKDELKIRVLKEKQMYRTGKTGKFQGIQHARSNERLKNHRIFNLFGIRPEDHHQQHTSHANGGAKLQSRQRSGARSAFDQSKQAAEHEGAYDSEGSPSPSYNNKLWQAPQTAGSLSRLMQKYQVLVDLLGSIIFGDQKTDIQKLKDKLNLPQRKLIQGRRLVRDIIAGGGTKTFQLNNMEMLFQAQQVAPDGSIRNVGSGSPPQTITNLKQLIELQNRSQSLRRLDLPAAQHPSKFKKVHKSLGEEYLCKKLSNASGEVIEDMIGKVTNLSETRMNFLNQQARRRLSQQLLIPLEKQIMPRRAQNITDLAGTKNHSKIGRKLDHNAHFKNLIRNQAENENFARTHSDDQFSNADEDGEELVSRSNSPEEETIRLSLAQRPLAQEGEERGRKSSYLLNKSPMRATEDEGLKSSQSINLQVITNQFAQTTSTAPPPPAMSQQSHRRNSVKDFQKSDNKEIAQQNSQQKQLSGPAAGAEPMTYHSPALQLETQPIYVGQLQDQPRHATDDSVKTITSVQAMNRVLATDNVRRQKLEESVGRITFDGTSNTRMGMPSDVDKETILVRPQTSNFTLEMKDKLTSPRIDVMHKPQQLGIKDVASVTNASTEEEKEAESTSVIEEQPTGEQVMAPAFYKKATHVTWKPAQVNKVVFMNNSQTKLKTFRDAACGLSNQKTKQTASKLGQKKEPKLLFKQNNVTARAHHQNTLLRPSPASPHARTQQRGRLHKSSTCASSDLLQATPRDYASFNQRQLGATSAPGRHSEHSGGSAGNYYHNFRVRSTLQKKQDVQAQTVNFQHSVTHRKTQYVSFVKSTPQMSPCTSSKAFYQMQLTTTDKSNSLQAKTPAGGAQTARNSTTRKPSDSNLLQMMPRSSSPTSYSKVNIQMSQTEQQALIVKSLIKRKTEATKKGDSLAAEEFKSMVTQVANGQPVKRSQTAAKNAPARDPGPSVRGESTLRLAQESGTPVDASDRALMSASPEARLTGQSPMVISRLPGTESDPLKELDNEYQMRTQGQSLAGSRRRVIQMRAANEATQAGNEQQRCEPPLVSPDEDDASAAYGEGKGGGLRFARSQHGLASDTDPGTLPKKRPRQSGFGTAMNNQASCDLSESALLQYSPMTHAETQCERMRLTTDGGTTCLDQKSIVSRFGTEGSKNGQDPSQKQLDQKHAMNKDLQADMNIKVLVEPNTAIAPNDSFGRLLTSQSMQKPPVTVAQTVLRMQHELIQQQQAMLNQSGAAGTRKNLFEGIVVGQNLGGLPASSFSKKRVSQAHRPKENNANCSSNSVSLQFQRGKQAAGKAIHHPFLSKQELRQVDEELVREAKNEERSSADELAVECQDYSDQLLGGAFAQPGMQALKHEPMINILEMEERDESNQHMTNSVSSLTHMPQMQPCLADMAPAANEMSRLSMSGSINTEEEEAKHNHGVFGEPLQARGLAPQLYAPKMQVQSQAHVRMTPTPVHAPVMAYLGKNNISKCIEELEHESSNSYCQLSTLMKGTTAKKPFDSERDDAHPQTRPFSQNLQTLTRLTINEAAEAQTSTGIKMPQFDSQNRNHTLMQDVGDKIERESKHFDQLTPLNMLDDDASSKKDDDDEDVEELEQ